MTPGASDKRRPFMEDRKVFTQKELSEFNGRDGKPVYVAFAGEVYDVTDSPLWKSGVHMNRHMAGSDMTNQVGAAPHGTELLRRPGIRVVGILDPGRTDEKLPALLTHLYRLFPSLRRHTHPASIHFPTAFLITGAMFTLTHLVYPGLLGLDLEKLAFLMLVLGTVFTVPTVLTGFLAWWVNYDLRKTKRINNLIVLSAILLAMELTCLALRVPGPVASGGAGIIYNSLMLLMAPMVMALGYNGGQLVFPTRVD